LRILYLDLNHPDLIEDYSRNSNKYGGGRIVASHLMPFLNENGHYMEIWADNKCFENVEEKYQRFCKHISKEQKQIIRSGVEFDSKDFDIVLHNFHGHKIRPSNSKDVVWLVGYGETVSPLNDRVILYNDFQAPIISNSNTKIYKARIGVPIPKFQEYKKEAFIFSCHRQSKSFGSELMMKFAHEYKVKYVTAGPKDSNFPNIQDYVDNKYVSYLGVIDAKTKTDLMKRAVCTTYLHNWPTPMNLSALESLSYGTPIISTSVGFWPSLVKNHENGFMVDSMQQFCLALSNIPLLSQEKCYTSIIEYSSDKMISDYISVFKRIINE
jgi:glycosyltransferase involved in cell wall biosynthesis